MEVEEEDASTWENEDGGKIEGMRKKRETGYRGYLYRLYLGCYIPACCATQSPHKEIVITEYLCGYCTLFYCKSRVGFVLYRSDDLILPKAHAELYLDDPWPQRHKNILPEKYVRFQYAYPGLQRTP